MGHAETFFSLNTQSIVPRALQEDVWWFVDHVHAVRMVDTLDYTDHTSELHTNEPLCKGISCNYPV